MTISNSASSLIQLTFGMLNCLILSLLLLWISLNHSFLFYIYVNRRFFFFFLLLINCKYMVCSRQCIVITIDRELYDVDVDRLEQPK